MAPAKYFPILVVQALKPDEQNSFCGALLPVCTRDWTLLDELLLVSLATYLIFKKLLADVVMFCSAVFDALKVENKNCK